MSSATVATAAPTAGRRRSRSPRSPSSKPLCQRPDSPLYEEGGHWKFCPRAHRLKMYTTLEDDWGCSACDRRFPKGTFLWHCFVCNGTDHEYDLCRDCSYEDQSVDVILLWCRIHQDSGVFNRQNCPYKESLES